MYYRNFGKRSIKSPKLYFCDTGLVSALTGIRSEEMYARGPLAGSLFENYVISEELKRVHHRNERAELYFYRDSNGVEIDLIADYGQHRRLVEIKKTATFRPRMVAALEKLAGEDDEAVLVYEGEDFPYGGRTQICNWERFLGREGEG